jgi:hypothetical protein
MMKRLSVTFAGACILVLAAGEPMLAADVQVNTQQDFILRHPVVALAPAGEILVAWERETDIPNPDYSVEGRFYGADGEALGPQFRISDPNLFGYRPAVASLGGGRFVVAWQGGGSIRARLFGADGMPEGDYFNASEVGELEADEPCIAVGAAGDGSFAITWINFSSRVALQRYAGNGAVVGSRIVIGDGVVMPPHKCPAIAFDAAGDFAVAWITQPDAPASSEIQLQRFAANGALVGGQIRADDGSRKPDGPPVLAFGQDGRLVVSWIADEIPFLGHLRKPVAQRYGADGLAQGGNTVIYERGIEVRALADAAGNVLFAIDADNTVPRDGLVVLWMTPTLEFSRGPVPIATDAVEHYGPGLGVNPAGRYVLTWGNVAIYRTAILSPDDVFADGFEGGDTARWWSSVP